MTLLSREKSPLKSACLLHVPLKAEVVCCLENPHGTSTATEWSPLFLDGSSWLHPHSQSLVPKLITTLWEFISWNHDAFPILVIYWVIQCFNNQCHSCWHFHMHFRSTMVSIKYFLKCWQIETKQWQSLDFLPFENNRCWGSPPGPRALMINVLSTDPLQPQPVYL